MPSGIPGPLGSALNNLSLGYAAANIGQQLYTYYTTGAAQTIFPSSGYRPFEWAFSSPLTYLKVEEPTSVGISTALYFFDAVLRIEHTEANRITEHPVQNGANISDHAFELPSRLTLEIGMSDAMDSYQKGQFTQVKSRSVSAYQTLLKLKQARIPVTIVTRLKQYTNMVIEQIHAPDDNKTLYGLKCIVSFRQIITAEVSEVTVSARPQVTGKTEKGAVQGLSTQSSVLSRFFNYMGIEE